jgi:hypothetical protein
MNITYLIYGSVGLGVLILLSNIVDFSYWVSKLFLNNKPQNELKTDKEKEFLTIVGLWYQLKEKCDSFDLIVASKKLDEVFPLLNGVLEDEKVD